MATDYTHIFAPGQAFTRTTSGSVTAGQALVVSGDDTVAAASGASSAYIGIAAFDAGSGAEVTVLSGGVHELAASGSISAGDLVTTAASGAVAAQGTPSAANDIQVIGVALKAAASKVTVKLFR
ncbi:MAG TPA: DUF2190 family protein [Mycolicibacterium fallax]|nr:DUF2190 family protein [Mycolicibacterium fallax]